MLVQLSLNKGFEWRVMNESITPSTTDWGGMSYCRAEPPLNPLVLH